MIAKVRWQIADNGPETGQYDHNEIYTFTICVENATEIIIAFNFFSLKKRMMYWQCRRTQYRFAAAGKSTVSFNHPDISSYQWMCNFHLPLMIIL